MRVTSPTRSATMELATIETVDGAGSGLDADLLDGQSSAAFALSATTMTAAGLVTGGGSLASNRTFTVTAASAVESRAMTSTTVALTPGNLANAGVLTGLLNGMTLATNGSDATNDIDFTAGYATDSTGVEIITAAALTKQLDANFAAGTNAGGLDTGAVGNNTYHCFAIKKDSDGTGDFLFSLSATAPTMPSGYTKFRRIGSLVRTAGANVPFVQYGDTFLRAVPVISFSSNNPGTSAVTAAANIPAGVAFDAILDWNFVDATPAAASFLLVTALTLTDTVPSATVFTHSIAPAGATIPARNSGRTFTTTDTSRQFRYRIDASDTDHTVNCMTAGWIDRRGRF